MKQVIFLGFHCQIYKKAPIARIYVGDVMIDEIEIPEFYTEEYIRDGQLTFLTNNSVNRTLLTKDMYISQNELTTRLHEKKHTLDNYWWEKEKMNHFTFEERCTKLDKLRGKTLENIKHPKIFVYVIDDKILESSNYKLKIEIKNSDSNYMNGFISKSTLLFPTVFYIMPYILFEDTINYTQRHFDLYSRKSTAYELKKIISWYKKRLLWPRNFNDYFISINKEKKESPKYVFGGDVTLEITMKKKYGIYWPKEINPRGFFWINYIFIKDFVMGLIDK